MFANSSCFSNKIMIALNVVLRPVTSLEHGKWWAPFCVSSKEIRVDDLQSVRKLPVGNRSCAIAYVIFVIQTMKCSLLFKEDSMFS